MATLPELTQRLDSELQGLLSTTFGISSPSDHVAPVNNHDNQVFPSLDYQTQITPIKRGLDGENYVDEVVYNGTEVSHIVYRKDFTLYFDVTASVGGDSAKKRDKLYTAVDEYFTNYTLPVVDEQLLHEDVNEVRVGGSEDESRPDDAVRGDRLSIEIDFSFYMEFDGFEPMRRIATEVSVDEHPVTFDIEN